MNSTMVYTRSNKVGTDYDPDWSGHRFVIDKKPWHDKLRNGTITQQLMNFGRVIICADGVIDGKEARMYLAIKPEHLLKIEKIKAVDSEVMGSLRKKDLKKAYKSLTVEDIERLYSSDKLHSLVLIQRGFKNETGN